MPNTSPLDPVTVAQLGNLQLRARRVLDGLFSGRHINRNRGHSQDFSEHRPYNPGDDIRNLDWKIFGRTDRLVVKQYEEQTNFGAMMFLDDSASMGFSWAGRPSKLEYAKTMAAAMAYLIVNQNDAVGLASRQRQIYPGSQRGHLDRLFDDLQSIQPAGVWDASALKSLAAGVRKRSFIVVFSDLMSEAEAMLATLRALNSRRHEILVFQILDPAERDLPFDGPILFEDMETKETLKTDAAALRSAYQRVVREKLEAFSHAFRSSGIDYVLLTTDLSFEKGMGAFLSWRGSRI